MAAKKDPAASRESKTVKRKPMKSSEERNLLKTIEDFLHFDEQSLREQGVLVQREMNKKLIKFPLKNGKFVTVKSGSLMTFFKFGNLIALKKSNKMFELLIDQDHIEAVFKDFSPEQLKRNESSKRNFFKPKSRTAMMKLHEMKNKRKINEENAKKYRVGNKFSDTLNELFGSSQFFFVRIPNEKFENFN